MRISDTAYKSKDIFIINKLRREFMKKFEVRLNQIGGKGGVQKVKIVLSE